MSDILQSRKKKWHFSVEKDFICDTRLHPMSRMLYLVLTSFASPTSPVPFPGMKLLADLLNCTEDTVRKYRQDLEKQNWLMVERRRDGHNKFVRNAYILLDGPEEIVDATENVGAMPKKPDTAFFRHGEKPSRLKPGNKSVPAPEEKTSEAKSNQQQQYRAFGDGAAAAADPTPSADSSGETPEPPGPRRKAETFIQDYRRWGKAAKISATVIPSERDDLQGFFTENPETTPEELTAIMLTAWMMETPQGEDTYDAFWHCRVKSRRIKTFLQFLPNIQDEINWKGASQVEKAFAAAQRKYVHKKAA